MRAAQTFAVSIFFSGFIANSPVYGADLRTVLADISKTSPALIAREATVTQQEIRIEEARAGYFPTALANAAIERRRLEVGGAAGQSSSFTAKSLGVEARLPLFRGFQTVNSVKLRKAELESGRATFRGAQTSLLFDAVNSYLDVSSTRKILKFNEKQVELIQGQLSATRTRLAKGEATKTDESQAEARLAVATAGRVAAQEALLVSESDYKRIVGQAPDDLAPAPAINNMPTSLEEAQTLAFTDSPEIAAAKANEVAATHGVAFSKGFLYPSVDAVAGVDYLAGGVANLFTGALPEDRKAFYGGVQAQVPLYQGGSEYAGIKRAKAFLDQRKAERDQVERTVAGQVSQAWVQWSGAKATIDSARAAVIANEKAAEGVRRESIGGNRTILDVLDAQRELLDARVGLERATRNEYVARAALMGAIGRLEPQNFATAQ
jgi:outer membrane protein